MTQARCQRRTRSRKRSRTRARTTRKPRNSYRKASNFHLGQHAQLSDMKTARVAVLIVTIAIVAAAGFVAGSTYFSPQKISESATPSNYSTVTTRANSTYTFGCPRNATCDFFLSLSINITCTGCSFAGEYIAPTPDSNPTRVSGTGTQSYYASSFDSPLSLTWNISKNSSGGTLEVRVSNQGGQVHYDRNTSAPFGTLAGEWYVAVASGT